MSISRYIICNLVNLLSKINRPELYISCYAFLLLHKNKISLLGQFRCGVLPLATETGRYRQIPSNKIYCTFCDENAIEDEINFLCTCNSYSEFRYALFHNIDSIKPTVVNISAMSGIDLLTFLMNDQFVKYVAYFI